MSSLDSLELIHLNKNTVAMMAQGDHVKAGPALRSTMNSLGGLLGYLRDETNAMDLEDFGAVDSAFPKGAPISPGPQSSIRFLSVHEGLFATKQAHPEGGVLALFDKAIDVSAPQAGVDTLEDTPWNFKIELSVAVLYNAGLFCHLKGKKSGQASYIQKGLRYYTVAHEMLSLWNHQKSEMNSMLALAILNNLGHAEYMLGNFQAAWEIYQDVEPMVMECLAQVAENGPSLSTEVLDFFLVTSCVGSPNSFSISPAA